MAQTSDDPDFADDEASPTPRSGRWMLHGLFAIVLIVACVTGFAYVKDYLDETVAPPNRPEIVFRNRPIWMTDAVADQLAREFRPADVSSVFDRKAVVDVYDVLLSSPWVSAVRQVRRTFRDGPGDVIEVDCDFRAPMALVQWKQAYRFVDAHGVMLPDQFSEADVGKVIYSSDGRPNIRVIEGVRRAPPAAAGQQWLGEDLAAGLELVARLYDQPFAHEIERVNVLNFGGRVDPRDAQLVLRTRYNTEVRWGRPWNATDAFIEISPERKLDKMQRVVDQFGRVDAHQPWIDIRFDKITYPSPVEAAYPSDADLRHADTGR